MPTPAALTIGLHGASGRLGSRIAHYLRDDPSAAMVVIPGRGAAIEGPVDAIIDVTSPAGTMALVAACEARKIPLVVGTTGLEPEQRARLEAASRTIPLMISANFSRAVNLLFRLAGEAAKVLGDSADVEIVERHHHFKKDAPSGTALKIADVVGKAIGSNQFVCGRGGLVGERPKGEIGLHALRTGDNPGEHTVVFGLLGECLELSHRALNRDGFARGAIDAARFLAGKPPGLYTMDDLLGF